MRSLSKMKYCFTALSILILFFSCSKDEDGDSPKPEKQFLVDKIYNYDSQLVAEYIYNGNHQLVQRKTNDPVNQKSSDTYFEYTNGEVSLIRYEDHNNPEFNHQKRLIYNNAGQIVRDETYMNNAIINHNNYHYTNNKIQYVIKDQGDTVYRMAYNNNNCHQLSFNLFDEQTGQYYLAHHNYIFDSHPKPYFGIDKVFQIEILPQFGEEALMPKALSEHNLIEFVESGTKWIYEYNEDGLPKTIETKWKDIETEKPMLLRLHYIEI